MKKELKCQSFVFFNGRTPMQQLVAFVNENGIKKEDILTITNRETVETLYYYV